jgi:hypothetical protein
MAFDPLSSIGILAAVNGGQRSAEAVLGALGGDVDAIESYTMMNETIWHQYKKELAAHYACETRWALEPFWRRRVRPVTRGADIGVRDAMGILNA